MLRAGALFVAVTISFVIAVILSLLIIVSYQYKIQNKSNLLQKKLERNVYSGFSLLLSSMELEGKIVDLYNDGEDSLMLEKKNWGVYEVASVKAFSGKHSFTKTILYGYQPDEILSGAIYLSDLNRPLSLCGKTVVTGDCFLPEAGVKRGYIEGKGYEGKTLINGKIQNSKNTLPLPDKVILKNLSDVFNKNPFQNFLYKEVTLNECDTLVNSFLDTTVLIRLDDVSLLSGKLFSGNIILYSIRPLAIDVGVVLEDVLVFAPSIKINKGFNGSLQVFASDSIIVEEQVQLLYPSALGLFKVDYKVKQPFIQVMKNARVNGIIMTIQSEFISDLTQTLVSIEKDAMVHGQIYAEGFADVKGQVYGSIWCNKFLLKTLSSVYENHIMDAIIDRTKLSEHYVGSGLIAAGKKKKIVKWLE